MDADMLKMPLPKKEKKTKVTRTTDPVSCQTIDLINHPTHFQKRGHKMCFYQFLTKV